MVRNNLFFVCVIVGLFFTSCEKDLPPNIEEETPEFTGRSTWKIIQQDILNQSCTGCHVSGASFAELRGQSIRLRIHLQHARLFSFTIQ